MVVEVASGRRMEKELQVGYKLEEDTRGDDDSRLQVVKGWRKAVLVMVVTVGKGCRWEKMGGGHWWR